MVCLPDYFLTLFAWMPLSSAALTLFPRALQGMYEAVNLESAVHTTYNEGDATVSGLTPTMDLVVRAL